MKRVWAVLGLTAIFAISIWFHLAPPRWWLNLTKPVDMEHAVESGAAVIEKYKCRDCHTITGRGEHYAPDLSGVTHRLDPRTLRLQIRNPGLLNPGTRMPNLKLSDPEIDAVVAYLVSVDASSAPYPYP